MSHRGRSTPADHADPRVPVADGVEGPTTTGEGPMLSRRAALTLAAGGTVAATALSGASRAPSASAARPAPAAASPELLDVLRPAINARDRWGADLPVTGEILPEDDVRFLLVHHTASRNDYGPDEVVGQIRDFHRFHTSPDKGWPDVAYNFFVDRFGGIWEARAGSLAGPVRGDATGGSQGFALLCSLIGDHSRVEVSPEALEGLTRLLAWLAERHGVDTAPGATVDFVSRGSNRWPAGTPVTAATISGHRDMSQTSCPGDFAYALLADALPAAVTALRASAAGVLPASTTSTTGTTATTAAPSTGVTLVAPTTAPTSATVEVAAPAGGSTGTARGVAVLAGTAATAAAVFLAGLLRLRRRAMR